MEKLRSMVYPSTVCFAGVVARVESLQGRMSEAGRRVDALSPTLHFGDASRSRSLLSESFHE
jgi:hypothetical protein